MADTRPTPVKMHRAVYLCLLGVFVPSKLVDEEEKDSAARKNFSSPPVSIHHAYIVRRAFWNSFGLVLASLASGYLLGLLSFWIAGTPRQSVIFAMQIVGASILLWGTLFVRGWEVQTYCGVTLTERVNQWLYRFLYFGGTAVIVWSLTW
ncbi:hypothetical protein [Nitrospira sp. M1]